MQHNMRSNNLEIRITGSSCRPQLILLLLLLLLQIVQLVHQKYTNTIYYWNFCNLTENIHIIFCHKIIASSLYNSPPPLLLKLNNQTFSFRLTDTFKFGL